MEMRKRKARLTKAEDNAWVFAFEYAVNCLRYGQERADKYAWERVCEEFPRLKKFTGARP
jgi:hypothetical protein